MYCYCEVHMTSRDSAGQLQKILYGGRQSKYYSRKVMQKQEARVGSEDGIL